MPAYTDNTDSPITITQSIRTLRVIAVGEGGAGTSYSGSTATNGDDGADTTFMGITAEGGSAGVNQTAGTGGGATATTGTILSSSSGADGGSPATIDGGVGHTFTSPSLGSITKGAGEDGVSDSATTCTDGFYSGFPYINGCPATSPGGGGGTLCANIPQPPDAYRHCYYNVTTTYNGGGGGAGGFIEVQFSQSELTSYYGSQSYSVNSAGSGELNGFLEVIYFFTDVYIKTSLGWQLVKNIYVNQSEVGIGWTTSVANLKNYGW